jgi:plasmid stabilization system protein ParE
VIVRIAAPAQADLEAIGDWIAQNSPARALTFVAELREACLTLAELPEGYPLVPRYKGAGIRRRVYGSYLIFYRVLGREIQVLHVLHGARDYGAILFPDE